MKTAMQELIEQLELSVVNERRVCDEQDKYHQLDVRQAKTIVSEVGRAVLMAKSLLQKEKQQIVDAAYNGFNNSEDETFNGEDYYNETFKQ